MVGKNEKERGSIWEGIISTARVRAVCFERVYG